MTEFLRSEMTSNVITLIFALWTFTVLMKGMSTVKSGKRGKVVEIAPTMMTSIGILGTFVGIVMGLFAFDPSHVDESIRGLLGGLRTAFVTSVVGMGCTMYFKWWDAKQAQSPVADTVPETVGPKEIYGVLRKQHEHMSLLVQAIGGGEENSLVGQIKLMRTDLTDFRVAHQRARQAFEEKLWTQLQTFADMLSKSATQQVIEALKEVITDFNRNLTEQFGDNFKRLDESVKKLVDWQAEYRGQLERMITLYDQGVQSIDATRTAVVDIKDRTGRIPDDMQALSSVLNVNQHQIQELGRHLEAFIAMRQQAVQAVPEIQHKLEEVGDKLREGAEKMNRIILDGATEFGSNVANVSGQMLSMAGEVATKTEGISQELTSAMEKVEQNTDRIRNGISEAIQVAMQAVQASVEETSKASMETSRHMALSVKQTSQEMIEDSRHSSEEVRKAVEATLATLRQSVERGLGGVEMQISEAVGRTGEAVNVQLRAVDQALEKQLNIALSQLGSALATIANHLVDTYKRQAREATPAGAR